VPKPSHLFDPQKHPINSGLFIEVVGSLLVVFLAFIASKLDIGSFFKKTIEVHLWLFVFISSLAAIALLWQIKNWIFAKKSKRIVLVIPALAQNGWFAELIQAIFKQLHSYDYEVILKVPYEDLSRPEQKRIFDYLEKHPDNFIGGIIIIYKHENITKEITELCNKVSYPVVFADVRPFEHENDYPPNTAFVGYDERLIGELAAKRVARYLREKRKEKPIVKVICSADSQTKRQDAFCEELRELIPDVNIDVKREGGFRRSKAKDIAMKFFEESIDKAEYIDAVFCTNDEMALGVYDAMLTVKYVGFRHPFLIGVDRTKSAERLIRAKDAFFNATIAQSTEELAQKTVMVLNQKIKKELCPIESSLVPKPYDEEIAQAEDKYRS
jgi:DNA-binding LacI/PurR family transcriptional regulator